MNKIIGLVVSWGSEKWIDLVIKQALYACDEVIVSIGPHSPIMSKYEDKTLDIVKSYGDRVKIVPVVNKGNHSTAKASTMNAMLNVSDYYSAGNWIWLLDDDEFYHKHDIDKIKDIIQNENYNYIFTNEMFFYIDMEHYLINKGGRGRLWKIESRNHVFKPTNNWTGPRDKIYHYGGNMYHYSLLMNPYAKMDFWGTEYSHGQNHKVKWVKDIYLNYDLSNEPKWLDKCQSDFNIRNPFPMGKGEFYCQENGELFNYYDEHPRLIHESGLISIKDFRKIYGN